MLGLNLLKQKLYKATPRRWSNATVATAITGLCSVSSGETLSASATLPTFQVHVILAPLKHTKRTFPSWQTTLLNGAENKQNTKAFVTV